jgi:hypothetical protein
LVHEPVCGGDEPTAHALASAESAGRTDCPQQTVPSGSEADPDALTYLAVASCCYAIVQYDTGVAGRARRITGLFGDVPSAEQYALNGGFNLYDIVSATAVIAKAR